MKIILLAAGVGRRFGEQTKTLPKCLIPLGKNQETLLSRYFESFRQLGLNRVVVVCGHQKEKLKKACKEFGHASKIQFIFNPRYREGSIVSLYSARKELNEDCLVMDADVYFPTAVLKKLLDSKHQTCFLVDRRTKSTGEEMMLMARRGRPVRISKTVDQGLKILGESIGFFKIQKKHAIILRKILEKWGQDGKRGHVKSLTCPRFPSCPHQEYEESYNILMQKVRVGTESTGKHFWTEMDFKEDLRKIQTRKA